MSYEIATLGADGAQGAGRALSPAIPTARAPAPGPAPRLPVVQVETRHAAYAALAGIKDEASQIALTVREMHRALRSARTILESMRQAADAVRKQYPPFPAGSEQRLSYLRSIAALRQQLDAVTVPPRDDQVGFIFFPRSSDLPELDPTRALDAEVAAFGRALDALQQSVTTSQAMLRERVAALPAKLNATLPSPLAEHEVMASSQAAAAQLSMQGASLVRDAAALAQIGG